MTVEMLAAKILELVDLSPLDPDIGPTHNFKEYLRRVNLEHDITKMISDYEQSNENTAREILEHIFLKVTQDAFKGDLDYIINFKSYIAGLAVKYNMDKLAAIFTNDIVNDEKK